MTLLTEITCLCARTELLSHYNTSHWFSWFDIRCARLAALTEKHRLTCISNRSTHPPFRCTVQQPVRHVISRHDVSCDQFARAAHPSRLEQQVRQRSVVLVCAQAQSDIGKLDQVKLWVHVIILLAFLYNKFSTRLHCKKYRYLCITLTFCQFNSNSSQ